MLEGAKKKDDVWEVNLSPQDLTRLQSVDNLSPELQYAVDGYQYVTNETSVRGNSPQVRVAAEIGWAGKHGHEVELRRDNRMYTCDTCDKKSSYHNYKSGMRKGQPNYNRPIYVNGWQTTVRSPNSKSVHWYTCYDCFPTIVSIVKELLLDAEVALPDTFIHPDSTILYHSEDVVICKTCNDEPFARTKNYYRGNFTCPNDDEDKPQHEHDRKGKVLVSNIEDALS